MKIIIIDSLGLCDDGDTLSNNGLCSSKSAAIIIPKELAKIGFGATVYN